MGDAGATAVSLSLGRLGRLERLDLDHNGLGAAGCLAAARAAARLPRLRTLYLRNFEPGEPLGPAARAAIRRLLPHVTEGVSERCGL